MWNSDSGAGNLVLSGLSCVAPAKDELMDGDVVVVRRLHVTPPFGVLQVPGSVQFGASTCEAAVQLARGFAQAHKVDLWYCEQDDLMLLDGCRPRWPDG